MSRHPVPTWCVAAGATALAAALAAGCGATATLADEGPLRPARLAFSIEPEYAVAGRPIGPGVAVTVLNNLGDTAYSSTATITVSVQSGTGTALAHLGGTTQVAAVNGTADFTGVSIDSAGTGYHLIAASAGLGSALSDSFDVTAPPGPAPVSIPSRAAAAPDPPVRRHR